MTKLLLRINATNLDNWLVEEELSDVLESFRIASSKGGLVKVTLEGNERYVNPDLIMYILSEGTESKEIEPESTPETA